MKTARKSQIRARLTFAPGQRYSDIFWKFFLPNVVSYWVQRTTWINNQGIFLVLRLLILVLVFTQDSAHSVKVTHSCSQSHSVVSDSQHVSHCQCHRVTSVTLTQSLSVSVSLTHWVSGVSLMTKSQDSESVTDWAEWVWLSVSVSHSVTESVVSDVSQSESLTAVTLTD